MYDDIAHTSAMDNYALGNPALHSHTPCCAMPASWMWRNGIVKPKGDGSFEAAAAAANHKIIQIIKNTP